MASFAPALLPDPLAIGLRRFAQGFGQGRAVDRMKAAENNDFLSFMQHQSNLQGFNTGQQANLQDPGFQAQLGQQIQGAGGQITPTQAPPPPTFQSEMFRRNQATQALRDADPAFQLQQELTRAQIGKLQGEAENIGQPTFGDILKERAQNLGQSNRQEDIKRKAETERVRVSERKADIKREAFLGNRKEGVRVSERIEDQQIASAIRAGTPLSVGQQLHDFAVTKGHEPGTQKYDDITRGLRAPTKETLNDFKIDLIKKKQAGINVKGFETLTPADILKLDAPTINNTFNAQKQLTPGQLDSQSKKQAFLKTAQATRDLWDKSYTGPIQGRITWIKNRLAGGTKDSAKFEAGVASVLESMYQRAGKQLSDKEIEKWAPFLPKITDPDSTFDGKWENLVDNVSTYLSNEENLANLAGYAVPGQTPPSASQPQQPFNQATATRDGKIAELKRRGWSDDVIQKALSEEK